LKPNEVGFKADPKNKAKLYKTGLWGWSRHPNFAANIVFGFSYGLAAGGLLYALMTGGMYASNMVLNAIPRRNDVWQRSITRSGRSTNKMSHGNCSQASTIAMIK
jgi:hypothetical protein